MRKAFCERVQYFHEQKQQYLLTHELWGGGWQSCRQNSTGRQFLGGTELAQVREKVEGEKMTSTSGLREQSLGRQSVAMEVAPSRKSNSPDGEQISEVGAYRSVRRLQSCSNASPLLLRLAPRVTRRQKEQGEPAQTRRAHFERAKMTQLSPTPNRRRDGEEAPTSVSWLDATETTPVSTRQQDGRNKPHPSLQIESLAITTLARR